MSRSPRVTGWRGIGSATPASGRMPMYSARRCARSRPGDVSSPSLPPATTPSRFSRSIPRRSWRWTSTRLRSPVWSFGWWPFRSSTRPALLAFLGVEPSDMRSATYARLRPALSAVSRAFWDAHPRVVQEGVVHGGKFERYLRAFRRWALPLVHSGTTMRALREPRSQEEQRSFYRDRWDTARWRLLFRLFFSRLLMGRMGRDPALFDHVEGSVGERILGRTKYALSEIPTANNPYLAYIMTGNFPVTARPRYLRSDSIELIRDRIDRIRWTAQRR
jgi:S-adenosylmethionine:diacylglycerol 3-amino-3-carboxypropyl transferase